MNKMSSQEFADFRADAIVGLITALFAGAVLYWWFRDDFNPTLPDESCAPSKPVIVNGEKVGCTNDPPSDGSWHPDWDPKDIS